MGRAGLEPAAVCLRAPVSGIVSESVGSEERGTDLRLTTADRCSRSDRLDCGRRPGGPPFVIDLLPDDRSALIDAGQQANPAEFPRLLGRGVHRPRRSRANGTASEHCPWVEGGSGPGRCSASHKQGQVGAAPSWGGLLPTGTAVRQVNAAELDSAPGPMVRRDLHLPRQRPLR